MNAPIFQGGYFYLVAALIGKNILQVIDRKYIDAKVIEAHIVPGKLLLTR